MATVPTENLAASLERDGFAESAADTLDEFLAESERSFAPPPVNLDPAGLRIEDRPSLDPIPDAAVKPAPVPTQSPLTPLMDSVRSDDYDATASFLYTPESEISARVESGEQAGMTALMFAKNPKMAQLLIDRGADVDARDAKGLTPFLHAVQSGNTELVQYYLSTAQNEQVAEQLVDTPIPFGPYQGRTALSLAPDAQTARALIPHATIDKADSNGWTALTYAAVEGRKDVVEELRKAGAHTRIGSGHDVTKILLDKMKNEKDADVFNRQKEIARSLGYRGDFPPSPTQSGKGDSRLADGSKGRAPSAKGTGNGSRMAGASDTSSGEQPFWDTSLLSREEVANGPTFWQRILPTFWPFRGWSREKLNEYDRVAAVMKNPEGQARLASAGQGGTVSENGRDTDKAMGASGRLRRNSGGELTAAKPRQTGKGSRLVAQASR